MNEGINKIDNTWKYPFILIFSLSVLDVLSTIFALEAFSLSVELNGLVKLWIESFGIVGTGIALINLYIPLVYALFLNHKKLGSIHILGVLKVVIIANNILAIYSHTMIDGWIK